MKAIHTLITAALTLLLLVAPVNAQTKNGVTGISLQALPNAVSISWEAPSNANVNHYTIHYGSTPVLNTLGGRSELTTDDVPSFILLDLGSKGFAAGDTIYITVTYTDTNGVESDAIEEASTPVIIPANIATTQLHAASDGPSLQNAVAESATMLKLTFSKPVNLGTTPEGLFTILTENGSEPVAVLSAASDQESVILETAELTPLTRYIIIVADILADTDGNPVDQTRKSAVFIGRSAPEAPAQPTGTVPSLPPVPSLDIPAVPAEDPATEPEPEVPTPEPTPEPEPVPAPAEPEPEPEPEPDTTPPEDATNLVLKKIVQPDGNYTVKISWTKSVNTDGDLESYNLYESDNRGIKFVGPTALQALATSAKLTNVAPGTLTVKLTAVDGVGNESDGTEETIVLPETGASVFGVSILGAGLFTAARRRKRR